MKLLKRDFSFYKLLINPLVLGGAITFIIALLTHDRFEKFQVLTVSTMHVAENSRNYFHDLDKDGCSEWIETGFDKNDVKFPYYIVYSQLGSGFSRLINDQHNIRHPWLLQSEAFFGDVDADKQDEILFFTYSNDSLFLFCGDPGDDISSLFEIFLDTVAFRDESPDFIARILQSYDFDGDGHGDVLARISAGLSLAPREYYIYNYRKDTLLKSHFGFAEVSGATVCDIPGKGPVILPFRSYSPQNVKVPAPFTDMVSWLVLFDRNLDFVFPPIPNRGYKTNIQSFLREEEDGVHIYALFYDHDRKNNPPSLKKFDLNGKLLLERILDADEYPVLTLASTGPAGELYLKGPDIFTISEIMPDLEYGHKIHCFLKDFPMAADLNGDGQKEFISTYVEGDHILSICQENLGHDVRFPVGPYPGTMIFSPLVTADAKANLAVQAGDVLTYYRFQQNPLYYWNYLVFAGIWAGLSLFLYILLQVQKRMLRKKYEQERKMMELELMTIKNQVDPHFMFNIMNSIGSYILKEDKMRAYDYLIGFSRMIRTTLSHARDIAVSLEEEVAFVERYLELEKLRMSTDFQYSIRVDPHIDLTVQIPKMIIQTFAENAVKHGLMHKKGPGRLEIEIQDEGHHLQIRVEDNGIGRQGSRKLKTHGTGHGVNIVAQIVSLFNRLNGTEVVYRVEDLEDGHGQPAGTRVLVQIPHQHG